MEETETSHELRLRELCSRWSVFIATCQTNVYFHSTAIVNGPQHFSVQLVCPTARA